MKGDPMEIRVDHYHHFPAGAELPGLLTEILGELKSINKEQTNMSTELDRLKASTAAIKTVADSAVTLINGLAQQIRDNATDPAALNALADELDADQAELAAAVSANTPAPPAESAPAEPTA